MRVAKRQAVGWWCALWVLLYGAAAHAHEFTCEETFDGKESLELSTFPATVEVKVRVINTHPTSASDALKVESLVLDHEGSNFSTPFTVPVGASSEKTVSIVIHSYEECLALAALDGVEDGRFVAPVSVEWDSGDAKCFAEIVCKPPVCEVSQ